MPILSVGSFAPRLQVVQQAEIGSVSSKPVSVPNAVTNRWRKRVFFSAEVAAALALFAWQAPHLHGNPGVFVFLLALNLVSGIVAINVYGTTRLSMGFVITMTIVILFGIPGAVIVAPLGAISRARGRRALDVVTNGAFLTLVYGGSAAAYDALAEVSPERPTVEMVVGAGLATVVGFSLNFLLLATNRRMRENLTYKAFYEEHSWLPPYYAVMGFVAITLAAAYTALGVVGIVAFLTPVLMMRLAMKQYVDKTAENVEKLKEQNTALEQANVEISRVSDQLRLSYDGTLEALVNALDARDQETKGHSLRVSRYMLDIAREMGIKEGTQSWIDMQRGSLLHDVGKIGVSDTILLKPAKLTPEEWEFMRRHPEIGYNMLRQVKFLEGAAEIILAHHERWDGNGYPRGLNEDEIPLGARIFTVVDTFDSMTSDRPYRKAKTTLEAMDEILRCSGSQFDPRVVEAFLDIYEDWVKEREVMHGLVAAKAA